MASDRAKAFQSWLDYEPLADNYKAIGQKEIYLSDYEGVEGGRAGSLHDYDH